MNDIDVGETDRQTGLILPQTTRIFWWCGASHFQIMYKKTESLQLLLL